GGGRGRDVAECGRGLAPRVWVRVEVGCEKGERVFAVDASTAGRLYSYTDMQRAQAEVEALNVIEVAPTSATRRDCSERLATASTGGGGSPRIHKSHGIATRAREASVASAAPPGYRVGTGLRARRGGRDDRE